MQTTTSVLIVAALGILVCTTVLAQSQLYVYPQQGQSEEQQSKDRFECHNWAVQQSGFDPGNPPRGAAFGAEEARATSASAGPGAVPARGGRL